MIDTATLLWAALALMVLASCVFLISENRNPQATLAWMLALIFLPGLGLLLYVMFGRDVKAFSRQAQLLKQELAANAQPLLGPLLVRQDTDIARLEGRSVAHRKLMMLVRRNSQSVLTTRNRVEIQQDAATFYPSLERDLEAARRSIHLQYYIWAADSFTERLKALLAAKVRAGVEVRLLYDPQGSGKPLTRRYAREMRDAGIRMAPTSPLRLHTISYRNHRKITVIDGAIGYTGGMNIGQEHLGPWRDTQVRITGEGAAVLQAVFAVDWYNAVRENLFRDAYFPKRALEPARDDMPVQILTSGPDSQWAAIEQLYFAMIAGARSHVYLQSPYFIPDRSIAEALKAAALAGIDVRVMVTERPSSDRLAVWAGNTYIMEALQAGVRVFLYKKSYLHAKTISIDSAICSIGSANIDIRSFSINYELNAVLYSERLAGELERAFERDLADCSEFDVAHYARRGALPRFRDSVARLFSPLL